MEVNWRRIIASLLIYGVSSSLGLILIVFVMSKSDASSVSTAYMLPYMTFMFPALNTLRGRRGERTSVATQLIGATLIVAISLSTYIGAYFSPKVIELPYVGPVGALLAIVVVFMLFPITDRLGPEKNVG